MPCGRGSVTWRCQPMPRPCAFMTWPSRAWSVKYRWTKPGITRCCWRWARHTPRPAISLRPVTLSSALLTSPGHWGSQRRWRVLPLALQRRYGDQDSLVSQRSACSRKRYMRSQTQTVRCGPGCWPAWPVHSASRADENERLQWLTRVLLWHVASLTLWYWQSCWTLVSTPSEGNRRELRSAWRTPPRLCVWPRRPASARWFWMAIYGVL